MDPERHDDADDDTPVRLAGVDLVRVLGVLAILAGHVWYSSDTTHLLIYSWHVPVFFMLSGYLWQYALPFREELARRRSSILVPYVAWWLVVCVIYLTWATLKGFGLALPMYYVALAAWGGGLAFRPFTAFWFFTAFVVAVLFMRLVQSRPAWWALAGAVAAIVVMLLHGVPMLLLQTPRSGGLLDFAVVLTVSVGVALLVIRTKWAPWLSGRQMLR